MLAEYLRLSAALAKRAARHLGWRINRRLHETITISTRQGVFTVSTKDCGIGQPLYTRREYEYETSVRTLRFLIDQGLVERNHVFLVDVGANIGIISIGLMRAGLIQRAVAIEPEPRSFRLLETNVDRNGLSRRITCLNIAAGESRARLQLQLSETNYGDHRIRVDQPRTRVEAYTESRWQAVEVECLPLDQIPELTDSRYGDTRRTPSVLWVDVQGHEGFVFRGASNLLASGIPTVSEIWPYGILRSGMEIQEFVDVAARYWTHYWVDRRGKFVQYPISVLGCLIDELWLHHYENIVFTRES